MEILDRGVDTVAADFIKINVFYEEEQISMKMLSVAIFTVAGNLSHKIFLHSF
jgi:hypothetical protein